MPQVRGESIKRGYEDLGFTRAAFANLVEIPPRTLTNITANGATCSRAVAARIARGLGWTVDQVLAESATRPRDTRPAPTPKGTPPPQREQPKRTPKNQEVAA